MNVTCETGPHYLTLCDADLQEHGRFKMNPPLRSAADREALVAGLLDGTIDMIATDHAPHSAEETSRGLEKSAMGVVGIESAFPLMYTYLVETGLMPLEELVRVMSVTPRERFGITSDPGFAVFKVGEKYRINPDEFISKGRSTPFADFTVTAKCILTVYNGKAVYSKLD